MKNIKIEKEELKEKELIRKVSKIENNDVTYENMGSFNTIEFDKPAKREPQNPKTKHIENGLNL